MREHSQVIVKVNTEVDAGIAEIVSILNGVDGLQTKESCEGEPGERLAYVDFWYGDWRRVCEFAFDRLAPALQKEKRDDTFVSVEVFNGSRPTGRLKFSPEATSSIASELKRALSGDHKSPHYPRKKKLDKAPKTLYM